MKSHKYYFVSHVIFKVNCVGTGTGTGAKERKNIEERRTKERTNVFWLWERKNIRTGQNFHCENERTGTREQTWPFFQPWLEIRRVYHCNQLRSIISLISLVRMRANLCFLCCFRVYRDTGVYHRFSYFRLFRAIPFYFRVVIVENGKILITT